MWIYICYFNFWLFCNFSSDIQTEVLHFWFLQRPWCTLDRNTAEWQDNRHINYWADDPSHGQNAKSSSQNWRIKLCHLLMTQIKCMRLSIFVVFELWGMLGNLNSNVQHVTVSLIILVLTWANFLNWRRNEYHHHSQVLRCSINSWIG